MRLCSQGETASVEENDTSEQQKALDRFLVASKCRRHDRVALLRHTMYYAIATASGEPSADSVVAQFRGKPMATVQIATKGALQKDESLATLFSPTERTEIMEAEPHTRKRKRATGQVTLQVHVSEDASVAAVSSSVPTGRNAENVTFGATDETRREPEVAEEQADTGANEKQDDGQDGTGAGEKQDGPGADEKQDGPGAGKLYQDNVWDESEPREHGHANPLPPVQGQRSNPSPANTWTYQESLAEQYRLLRNAAAIMQANGAAPLDVAEMQVNLARLLACADILLEPWERTLATLR